MKIIVAPDSYKGSLTAVEVANTMKKGIVAIDRSYQVITKPMADGGEGTLDILLEATRANRIEITCTGPLGASIDTYYGVTKDGTALIETALIAGLTLVPEAKRSPDHTTTRGLGEVMLDALDRGCRSFIIGIGGSATNDGGLGMLSALGMQAMDSNGKRVFGYGKDLFTINEINLSPLDPRLFESSILIANDVDNPLCGVKGASRVYGPQKGLQKEKVTAYDEQLARYSSLIERHLRTDYKIKEGAGAAGGLGFAFLSIGATLIPGATLIGNTIDLEEAIKKSNLIFTGEGQSDEQTLYGKAPSYVANMANKYNIPTILLSGSICGNKDALLTTFSGCFSIVSEPITLTRSMEQAERLLFEQTKQLVHLIKRIK